MSQDGSTPPEATERESLFRREALAGRGKSLEGEVNLTAPLSWHVLGYCLLGVLLTSGVALAFMPFPEVQDADGVLEVNRGISVTAASRSGVVAKIAVTEGATVTAGQLLLEVSSGESLRGGRASDHLIEEALSGQRESLIMQSALARQAALSEVAGLDFEIRRGLADLEVIKQRIADQRHLVEAASQDYSDAERIAKDGFVSLQDLRRRETSLIQHQAELGRSLLELSTREGEIRGAREDRSQALARSGAESFAVEARLSEIRGALAVAERERGYAVTSPVDGVVAATLVKPGETVQPTQSLLMILPHGSRLQARLSVPGIAARRIKPGQHVRMTLNSDQGTRQPPIPGRVLSVSRVPVSEASDTSNSSYRIIVSVPQAPLRSTGPGNAMLPGMPVRAQLIISDLKLYEWLWQAIR